MNINFKRASQFELFPGASEKPQGTPERLRLFKDLTLSSENIIVLGIVFVMSMVVFFSLGVERGKRVVKKELSQPFNTQVTTLNKPMAPQATSGRISQKTLAVQQPAQNITAPINRVVPMTTNPMPPVTIAKTVNAVAPVALPKQLAAISKDVSQVVQNLNVGFTVQVASYKADSAANREADNLRKKGFEVFVLPKGDYFILCVGKFAQSNEAKKFSGKLKSRYKDNMVRRF